MYHEINFIEVRHQFTQEELNLFGPIIARLNQEWQDKELEKKTVMSDFKHQIDAIKEEFNNNCDKLNSGYEMREIRARLIKNYKTFEREYYSLDNFELVKTEPFKSHDYQRDINDNEEEKPFGAATDPTPEPEGTAETNPTQYAQLVRELNFWRKQYEQIPEQYEIDRQIEVGLEIQAKITALQTTLTAMEPESATDQPTNESEPDQTPPVSHDPLTSNDTN